MFLALNERQHIARLFDFLLQGELLAYDCASKQVDLFNDKQTKKFLNNQARQERFHCKVFKSGIGILTPRGISNTPGKKEMQQYRTLITEALERGDKAESLLGMQIMLEGLGDVAVKHISAGFEYRQLGYLCQRVRHLILGQEDAHHAFGLNRFEQLFNDQEIPDYLIGRSQDYLELLEQLIFSVSELFDYFDEQSSQYMDEFYLDLPDWIYPIRS
ncbi:MAG: hypothetical protein MI865_06085 [Proteobacteria bacterium]|nr:hypothetical protein [Pseudomonadota bacterium]